MLAAAPKAASSPCERAERARQRRVIGDNLAGLLIGFGSSDGGRAVQCSATEITGNRSAPRAVDGVLCWIQPRQGFWGPARLVEGLYAHERSFPPRIFI